MSSFATSARLTIIAGLVLGAYAAIAARLVDLHVVKHEAAAAELARVRRQVQELPARRGDILDRNGILLATSRTVVTVGVDPVMAAGQAEEDVAFLASTLGLESRAIREAILTRRSLPRRPLPADAAAAQPETAPLLVVAPEEGAEAVPAAGAGREVRWIRLLEGVDEQVADLIRTRRVPGVTLDRSYDRSYPGGPLAAHVLGFVNREGRPSMGVEAVMDFYLRGQDGWRESERDGRRRELPRFRTREIPAVDGHDVVLSLDLVIQHRVEQEVAEVVRQYRPAGVSIIVSEPATGFLLAMANWPTFDLNDYGRAPLDTQRNRAITDVYEPGSTFKIVALGGALDRGLVGAGSIFDCNLRTIEYRGRTLRLPGEAHRFAEPLTVAQIAAKSSNIGAAQLGMLLGEERLYGYARAFGFGEATGFALAGEVDGILAPPSRWDGLTITRLPMGHAVAATPLQIHEAMCAVANDGVLMRPQVVRRILDHDGGEYLDFEPIARRRVLSVRTARELARLLVAVVGRDGTAQAAEIPGFEIAGKTGTTQKIIDGVYSRDHHVATFSGFFPARDPRVAVTVVIDDAQLEGNAYGGRIAAPVFRNIAEELIQYLGVAPVGQSSLAAR